MAIARAVERDHLMITCKLIHQTAGLEVRVRHVVAVNEEHRRALAARHVVQPNSVHVDEPALGRIVALSAACLPLHPSGGGGSGGGKRQQAGMFPGLRGQPGKLGRTVGRKKR